MKARAAEFKPPARLHSGSSKYAMDCIFADSDFITGQTINVDGGHNMH